MSRAASTPRASPPQRSNAGKAVRAAASPNGRKAAAKPPAGAKAGARTSADPSQDAATIEPTARVLRQFRIVFNAVKAHFQQVERKAGVGGAQVWALAVIRDRPGLGVNELAAALDVRQPTASNLVKALASQDMVDVRREGNDRRAVQLHLRPEGRRVLRRAPGPFTGVLPQALASLDERTLARLERDLARLIKALGADPRTGTIPLASL